MIDFAKLAAPFPPDEIEWRVGSTTADKSKGMALAFLNARTVMDRLDAVCTPAGWQCRYSHANGKTVCDIGVKFGDEWIWKADGAGDTDFEAEKGALSDAFKRSAVRFGIGRYLYDLPAPWVAIEPYGKSYRIVGHELERLITLLHKGDGVKQNTLTGQSKQPAKFWSAPKLTIPLTLKHTNTVVANKNVWPQEVRDWWAEQFRNAVDKAPSRLLLAKLQEDNQHILDSYPAEKTHELCEACAVRAEQFDQIGG